MKVSWPTSAAGYTLQSSVQVTGGWSNDTTAAVQLGDQWVVTVEATGSAKFYRLIKAP